MYGNYDGDDVLSAHLASADTKRDIPEMRSVMRQVLQTNILHGSGSGKRSMLPHVVKLLASPDIVLKKLSGWYLHEASDQQDLVLLAVNTLLKDCKDPNPMIRGQALRTLTRLDQADLLQYAVEPITAGFRDSSAYVRRVAVTGALKLHIDQPELLSGLGIVDSLYEMIRDSDPVVVTNCLSALEAILADEGGIVINKNIAHFLLNIIHKFQDFGLVTIFELLKKYKPTSQEEVIDILNIADSYLKHHSVSVVFSCLDYFLALIERLPNLRIPLFQRAKLQLVAALGTGNAELIYIVLEFLSKIIQCDKSLLLENYSAFFCKYNEYNYVKEKKISILPYLVCDTNCGEILTELNLYSSDLNPSTSKKAIKAIAQIAQASPSHWDQCLEHFIQLLKMEIDYVSTNVLQVLQWLDLRQYGKLPELLILVPQNLHVVKSSEGRAAIWWLIGEHGEKIDSSGYLLEEALTNVDSERGSEAQLQLLTATVKLFFKRPPEMQDALGKALKVFSESTNYDVQDRVRLYYNLLETDLVLAQHLVLGS